MLPAETGGRPEDLQIALKHLQNLDPAGIGARNLAECLALQLEALPADTPLRAEALDHGAQPSRPARRARLSPS